MATAWGRGVLDLYDSEWHRPKPPKLRNQFISLESIAEKENVKPKGDPAETTEPGVSTEEVVEELESQTPMHVGHGHQPEEVDCPEHASYANSDIKGNCNESGKQKQTIPT